VTYAEHLIITVVTIWLVLYATAAAFICWQQRPGVGYDPNRGVYRATRQMWKERRRVR
jgi:hypothetical protein